MNVNIIPITKDDRLLVKVCILTDHCWENFICCNRPVKKVNFNLTTKIMNFG